MKITADIDPNHLGNLIQQRYAEKIRLHNEALDAAAELVDQYANVWPLDKIIAEIQALKKSPDMFQKSASPKGGFNADYRSIELDECLD
jgi:hypothetical protein